MPHLRSDLTSEDATREHGNFAKMMRGNRVHIVLLGLHTLTVEIFQY